MGVDWGRHRREGVGALFRGEKGVMIEVKLALLAPLLFLFVFAWGLSFKDLRSLRDVVRSEAKFI